MVVVGAKVVVGGGVAGSVGNTVVVTVSVICAMVVQSSSSSGQSNMPSHHFSRGKQSLLVGQILVPLVQGSQIHSQDGFKIGTKS